MFYNQYVYSLQLNENKNIGAAPPLGTTNGASNRVLTAPNNSISKNVHTVNSQSMQNKPNDTTGTTQKSTTGTEDILYDEENLHSSGESSLPKSEDDIAQLLVDKGLETKTADKAAEVVASFLSGESPTDAQLDVIASSRQAFDLFGELFGTDIDLASKNALDVVTKRIAERAGRVGGDISSGMFKSSLYTDGKLDYSKIELEYMPSYNLAGYRSLMKQYYEAGKSGASIDSVQNSGDVRLTDEAKRAAYEAGKQSSDLTSGEDSGIVKSGAVSGARNPDGEKARIHAEKYYGLIRTMKTDVAKIAKTTGLSKQQIQAIKNFIFYEKHDLGG